MKVTKHKVVTIDYTLLDEDGTVIESSKGTEPFSYVHGIDRIIPGLQTTLEGKSTGDAFTVAIPPDQAYGERKESLVRVVPRARFKASKDLEVGMRFQAPTASGSHIVTAVKIEQDAITVDGNHPLAGAALVFAIAILDVRDATNEELAHGRVTARAHTTVKHNTIVR